MNGYNVEFKCRNDRSCGGVCILIKESISYYNIEVEFDVEAVAIKLKIDSMVTALVSYYNPPNSKLSCKFLHSIKKDNKNYILLGDLNIILNLEVKSTT